MNFKITNYFIVISFLLILSCTKETKLAVVNNKIPDYTFRNVLNKGLENIPLQDLKGKVVILEFWATWCSPCIPAMKKLAALQNQFKDDLVVIAISSEKKERLLKFIENTKSPLRIVSDTLHTNIFKYDEIPHTIIIDKKGIVRAITDPTQITPKVIQDLISNGIINLEDKSISKNQEKDSSKVLKSISNLEYRIELKSYDANKRGSSKLIKNQEGITKGIQIRNSPLPKLYQYLFDIASPKRIVFSDSLSFADFPFKPKSLYNLTIETSENYKGDWKKIGVDFLSSHFNFNAHLITKKMDSYVLKNIKNTIKESIENKQEVIFRGTSYSGKKITMETLAKYIENFTNLPVLDKTNLNGYYDIKLDWQFEDIATLNEELSKYGLKYEKSEEELPVQVMEIYKKHQIKIKTE
ncbi:thioredoxin family protein [Flavobacteriales bacterium ALC-1]|nr:thioredoxin family protein [Flavobacteriales bacterium ALC-1]